MQFTTSAARALTLTAAVLALGSGLAACGGDDAPTPDRAAQPGAADTSASGDGGGQRGVGVNPADAAYVRQMIPHDAQLVVMSVQAQRSKNAEVQALAKEVRASQIEELRALRDFALSRRYDLDKSDVRKSEDAEALHTTADELGTPTTTGQSTADSDQAFVKALIAHHEGSLVMSRAVRKYGKDEALADLARKNVKALNDALDQAKALKGKL